MFVALSFCASLFFKTRCVVVFELSKSAGVLGDVIVYFEFVAEFAASARVALDSFRLGTEGRRESGDGDLHVGSSFCESVDLLRFGKMA